MKSRLRDYLFLLLGQTFEGADVRVIRFEMFLDIVRNMELDI